MVVMALAMALTAHLTPEQAIRYPAPLCPDVDSIVRILGRPDLEKHHMWQFDRNSVYSDPGRRLWFRGLREGSWTFEYEQEGYKLHLITRRIDDDDPITPKMNFVFALGTALSLQRSPIPPDKVSEMADNIRDAMRVFVTAPMFRNKPPLGRVLFAMSQLPDWSAATERPFP